MVAIATSYLQYTRKPKAQKLFQPPEIRTPLYRVKPLYSHPLK